MHQTFRLWIVLVSDSRTKNKTICSASYLKKKSYYSYFNDLKMEHCWSSSSETLREETMQHIRMRSWGRSNTFIAHVNSERFQHKRCAHLWRECRFDQHSTIGSQVEPLVLTPKKHSCGFFHKDLQNLLLHIKKGQIPHSFLLLLNTFYFLAIVYYVWICANIPFG